MDGLPSYRSAVPVLDCRHRPIDEVEFAQMIGQRIHTGSFDERNTKNRNSNPKAQLRGISSPAPSFAIFSISNAI
jgi:hypothetical protein